MDSSTPIDLVILGSGMAGLATAQLAAANGLRTTAVSYTHLTLPTSAIV